MVTTYESGVADRGDDWQPPTDAPRSGSVHRSTASVAGHPLHPAVVPIPIGLLSAAAVSDLAHMLTGDAFWARASRWLLAGGLLGGVMAAALGLIDFATIRKARGPIGVAHAAGNGTILGLSGISLLLRQGSPRSVPPIAMGLTALAAALLAVTGWLGGELAFRAGIGVVPDEER